MLSKFDNYGEEIDSFLEVYNWQDNSMSKQNSNNYLL